MKYANMTGAVGWSGGTTMLREGMSADPEHPLVKERPELFTDRGPEPDLRADKPKVETTAKTSGGSRVTKR